MQRRAKSQFSVPSFLTQSTEELRSGALLCFSKLLVSRMVTDKRQFSRLAVIIFCLTGPKNFVGDIFCVAEKIVYQGSFEIRERISRFSAGNIFSQRTEKYREGFLLCCWDFLLSEKFMITRGRGEGWSITTSRRRYVVSQDREFS